MGGGGFIQAHIKKIFLSFFLSFFLFVLVAVIFCCYCLFCFTNMLVDWVYNTKLLTYTNMPLSLLDTSRSDCIVLYCTFLHCILCFINSLIRVQCDL